MKIEDRSIEKTREGEEKFLRAKPAEKLPLSLPSLGPKKENFNFCKFDRWGKILLLL